MAYIMSKFTNQNVYIYTHTFRFQDYIHKLDSLNGFFYGRHKQIWIRKAIQIMWSDTVTGTETYTELPSQIRKSNTNTAIKYRHG